MSTNKKIKIFEDGIIAKFKTDWFIRRNKFKYIIS